ncbi:hypothetical protein OXPF_16950 [Oxobacter pfennigii]|uniref:Uncharacterized protein n=1 Tax=Oxobacter pfennigii TaxID=36849 RepID=A0A0P8X1C3_9CLOT|nr:hypothetical protein [Oxobacter pfennigii]KPU44612.1 hypothetical protein OXPF_16950 [Oxobacter pfennigii]
MNVHKRIEKENSWSLRKILISLFLMGGAGFFLSVLIREGFFMGWELYFALACYFVILTALLIIDIGIIRKIYYKMEIDKGKLKIRDGVISRAIYIPLDRVYYIESMKLDDEIHYESIIVIDKKVNHKKIKAFNEDVMLRYKNLFDFYMDLKERYPQKSFYYYKVNHNRYKFIYYMYMLYKNCERCKFSDTSMDIVKRYVEGR